MENSALVIVSGFILFSFVIVVIATTLVKSWREGLDLGLKKFEKQDRENIKKSFENGDFPEEKRLKIAVKQYAKHQQIFIQRQRDSVYMKTTLVTVVVVIFLLLIIFIKQAASGKFQDAPLQLGTIFFLVVIFVITRLNQRTT
ncbi:MAG: hypothetical protein ACR2KZ_00190, partial [Segetibacter sp.]